MTNSYEHEENPLSQDWVEQAISENNNSIISQMKDMFQQTVAEIKRSSSEQSDLQLREIKRMKYSEPHKFKRAGNEDQFSFNTKVKENLEEAVINCESNNLPKVKELLKEGISSLNVRQKHILLADSSDSGWQTVAHYKQHDLAEDSEDEKKILRAEARAKTKVAEQRKKVLKSKSTGLNRQKNVQFEGRNVMHPNAMASTSTSSTALSLRGTCFGCGRLGHFRAQCPAIGKATKST